MKQNTIIKEAYEISDPIAINRYLLDKGIVTSKLLSVNYNAICDKCGRKCDIAVYEDHTEKLCNCEIKTKVRSKTFSALKYDAPAQDVYDVAEALIGLQEYDQLEIAKIDNTTLA